MMDGEGEADPATCCADVASDEEHISDLTLSVVNELSAAGHGVR